MGNLKVNADIKKNRLYLSFVGIVTQKAMESLYTDVRFCVSDLKPGFDVISDYSECTLIHLNSIPALKKIMSYLIENQLGEIVRILHHERVSQKQVVNLAMQVQGYRSINVSTHEEAEEKLKNVVKRNALRVHLHNVPIEYWVINDKGTGNVIDISTTGCAVKFETLRPDADGDILLKIVFEKDDNLPELSKIKAKVVRVNNESFATEFTDLDNASKDLLWKYLIRESRR